MSLFLFQLETLNLAGNLLETVDERAFHGLRSLRDLNLDSNQLHRVPTISFRLLTELRSLSLNENHLIQELSTSAFEGLPMLGQLFLSGCSQLKRIQVNAFSGLVKLEILTITNNPRLSHIDSRAFEFGVLGDYKIERKQWPLRKLYLHANNFTTLPRDLIAWSNLDELDLRYNPWHCDCEFASWIGRALRKIYAQSNEKVFPDGALCIEPITLKGRSLHSLISTDSSADENDLVGHVDVIDCQPSTWTFPWNLVLTICTIVISVIFITTLVILGLRYRRRFPCYQCCCATTSYSGISPLKYRYSQPPGLPELCRYTKPIPAKVHADEDDQDPYAVRRLLADRRKMGEMDYSNEFYLGDNQRFLYDEPEHQYASCSTSGYYSAVVSENGSTRLAPTTPTLSNQGSFRVLQKYPVPITEL